MPIGKVFDAREGQVLFSPVSNYYQGKALRADISLREKQAEALQMEIDSAPAAAAAAARKEQRDEEAHQIKVAEAIRDAEKHWNDQNKEGMKLIGEAAAAFTLARREGVDPAVATEKLLSDVTAIYGEERTRQWFSEFDVNDDGSLQPEEEALLAANAEAIGTLSARDAGGSSEFERLISSLPKSDQERLRQMRAEKLAAPASDGSSVRERKIADAARMLGGDVETATKIVDGHLDMKQNEKTGMIELMDKVSGEAWEVPLTYDEVPTAEPEPGKTLWDLSGHATGPISAIKAAGNIPAAWIGLRTASRVTQARQTFRTTGQNFIRALAINPRFPVGEQERIREEIALVPAVFDSPSLMRDRMISLSGDLQLRMDQALADSKNTRLPEDTRKSQASNANEIKNFLAVMGVPNFTAEAPDYVTGEDKELWGNYSEQDRKKLYPQYKGEQ